ncbi:acyl-CoA thioesterase domain-containing protein [Streptomyces sp. NBC_00316]|uniref:acyl-CoA thioesterase domain-containing protein n=1 Tax=Streptomyces sp. NBC_00316 TaxID=2975710 RepID=UPI002E2A8FCE|nr:acyl-CoA thioesterase domain-containing protein [Streptomyces sp. NBC_00316]
MAQAEHQEAFFTRAGDAFVPAAHARSWWAPGMMHGRLLGALAARALEREHAAEGLHFTRLTVDLFRNAPMAPVRVETLRVRDGRRIRVVDATVHGPNGVVARAGAVLLRRSEQPSGHVPATPPWDAPSPEELPAPREGAWTVWKFDEHNVPVNGERHGRGRRRAWLRESCELVAGEALSPFVRAALAADTASPLAHAGDAGLQFINADYTLCLSRLPLSDAIGLESTAHTSEDGVAVGHCTLHDTAGPIGYCMTTAVANPRAGT